MFGLRDDLTNMQNSIDAINFENKEREKALEVYNIYNFHSRVVFSSYSYYTQLFFQSVKFILKLQKKMFTIICVSKIFSCIVIMFLFSLNKTLKGECYELCRLISSCNFVQQLAEKASKLEKEKADKESMEAELDTKADKSQVDGKLNRSLFDSTVADLQKMIDDLLSKLHAYVSYYFVCSHKAEDNICIRHKCGYV